MYDPLTFNKVLEVEQATAPSSFDCERFFFSLQGCRHWPLALIAVSQNGVMFPEFYTVQ